MRPPETFNADGAKRIVHIDIDPAEVYARYAPEVEIVSDLPDALRAPQSQLDNAPLDFERGWHAPVRARIEADFARDRQADDDAVSVPGALHVLREVLPSEGLLISDVGAHKMWIGRNFPVHVAGGCLVSNGLASMGISLPGGIAASLADPDRPVVAAMGDGGFLMNGAELETAVRIGARFLVVVFNDNDYGLISWKQRQSRSRSVSTRLGNPDFVAFAESFGIPATRAATPGAFREAASEALASRELRLIEVPVDTSANDRLVERLLRSDS